MYTYVRLIFFLTTITSTSSPLYISLLLCIKKNILTHYYSSFYLMSPFSSHVHHLFMQTTLEFLEMANKLKQIAKLITTEVAPPRFVSVTRIPMNKMLDTIVEEENNDFGCDKCFSLLTTCGSNSSRSTLSERSLIC